MTEKTTEDPCARCGRVPAAGETHNGGFDRLGRRYCGEGAMMRWEVREPDGDPDYATEIEADDAEDAASAAVEHWWDHGRWAGENPPDEVDVIVVGNGGSFDVKVSFDWSHSFHAHTTRERLPR